MVMFRRKAKATTYVWAISLDGTPITLEQLAAPGTAATAKVTRNDSQNLDPHRPIPQKEPSPHNPTLGAKSATIPAINISVA